MDLEQAKKFLYDGTNSPSLSGVPPGAAIPGTASILPMANAAASQPQELPDPRMMTDEQRLFQHREDYLAKNEIPGVPLDTDTGASGWERFILSFHREKENQIATLQKSYGEENVRQDTNGDLIVRVVDSDTGKPKDLKVQEDKLTAKDFIDLAGSIPEIAAGIISARRSRNIPGIGKLKGLLGLQRDIAAGAAGTAAAGTAQDIVSGLTSKGSADIPDILKERGAMALTDVAIGQATMGAGRLAKFMESPFHGSRKQVQFDALAAQKYFKDTYGVDVPLSIGESTGSPLVSRTEAFMEKLPGGGTPFKELKAEQESQLRKLQSIMMGKTPPTDEAVGASIIQRLKSEIDPAQKAVLTGQEELRQTGTQAIEDIVSGLTLPERQLLKSETGQVVRNAVVAKRDAAKAEAKRLFGVVKSLPGGEGKVFDASTLQERFREIRKSLPSPEQTTSEPTGILGPTGAPILKTSKGEEVLVEFIPPNTLPRLNRIANLKEAKFSLSDLQQMRQEVYDDIARGEGVPNIGTHYLNDMGKAITSAIEDGINNLPDDALKKALLAANEHYKKEVIPFNRIGITELFRNANEPGFLSNSEVVSRLFSGGKAVENYRLMKETLTPAAPEFVKLKRAVADNILESSRFPGGELIDPDSFIKNISTFHRKYREISEDIFGPGFSKMADIAKAVQVGGMDAAERNTKISSKDLAALLKDPSPTVGKLKSLIAAEAKQDKLYKNSLMKSVAKGELPDNSLNPEEFVNRFVSDATPSEVKEVMALVGKHGTTSVGTKTPNPLLDDVRAKMVENLFRRASRSATPEDIGKLMSGDRTRIVSGTSVFKQMESPAIREKLETILGPEVFQDLQQYIKLEAAGEAKEQAFQSAGGLAAGMQIANLTRRGPLRYMYESGKDWIVASLMTRQPLRAWLTSVPTSTEPGYVSLLLTSPPFLKAVTEEFGEGTGADAFVSSIKNSIDRWIQNDASQQQQKPTDFESRQKVFQDYLRSK